MNKIGEGKTYSFWQLLKETEIEIPIIQRDYAQGRKDKKELRIEFLSALYKAISENNPINLDFIYGSSANKIFQPLDGQQRLTTLFLLHWYAAAKDSQLNDETIQILKKFTYETRASSREFCNALINNAIICDWHTNKISSQITDSSWYFLSWDKDPTIDAMLRTIDDIHEIFFNLTDLWKKLVSDIIPISFYHIELENFGLTDDLYIKMNARGKSLTTFENFKAVFQKYIIDNNWNDDRDFVDTFSFKIDTKWADLFWKHRKDGRNDEAFIRFISTIVMIQMVLEKSENRIAKLVNLQRQPNDVRASNFTKVSYKYLYDCLDVYCKVDDEDIDLKLKMPFWQHSPIDNIFTALVYEGTNATYTQKVMFYAQTEYLLRIKDFNKEFFQCWMRVIRNIISRGDIAKTGMRPTIIRSPETFDGVINLISELAEGCGDIYTYLSKNSVKSAFAKEQVEEEKVKAKLINLNTQYEEAIFRAEDTNFCLGRIDFIFDCIDYDKKEEKFELDKFEEIISVIKIYLDSELDNDFRRGLLTISDENGKYNYYDYWWSWSYAVDANKRCLIDKYRELEYFIYGSYKDRDQYKQYLKKLIQELTKKELKTLIEDFVPPSTMQNWKIRLIKEPNLLNDKCKSNYIAIPQNEECCYLLKGIRPRDKDACEKIE